MQIGRALRLTDGCLPFTFKGEKTKQTLSIAFVGAGGKTTAIFELANEIVSTSPNIKKVIVTSTTHFGIWQIPLANHHIIIDTEIGIEELGSGVTLITGGISGDRTEPVNQSILSWLRAYAIERNIPLFIEADGSRQHPLKAPASHEPPIPDFVDIVIVIAGLSAIGKQLSNDNVFRADRFKELLTFPREQRDNSSTGHRAITPEMLAHVLTHPEGGLKNIPKGARRVLLLNQVETPELQRIGERLIKRVICSYDSILVGSLHQKNFHTYEKTAGIILAAGASTRFTSSKQLLDWKGKPFIRKVAETAIDAGLRPVIAVTGYNSQQVGGILLDLPVKIIHNEKWQSGQSSSVIEGIRSLPTQIGAAVFLLADQPQISIDVIQSLVDRHSLDLPAILAPLVKNRICTNPVLFDRDTFPDLLELRGDVGGRGIFKKYHPVYLPWHDDRLAIDVDTPEDYEQLKSLYN